MAQTKNGASINRNPMNPEPRNMKLYVSVPISNLQNPMNLDFTNSLREPHETRIFKIRFEIGDFWRRSGFVEIECLKTERLNYLPP
jgi:hypothetical protein